MAKRTAHLWLMAALTLALTACGQPSGPVAVTTPSSTPATSLSPSAPTLVDPAALAARIKRAVVPPDGLRSLGAGAPQEDGAGQWAVTTQCNAGLPSDSQLQASYKRTWKTSRGIVQSFVHGYSATTGARVVSEVRDLDGTCKSYRAEGENVDRRVLGQYTTTQPAGVTGFYAYCEQAAQVFLCFGFLGYDNLVAVVVSIGSDVAHTKADLDQVLPIAAKSLTQA
jgi:hypothetical protein